MKIIHWGSIKDCELIALPQVVDGRGALTFAQQPQSLPFAFERLFYMYDVPAGCHRGGHAHRECHQLLIAQRGAFTITLDDGSRNRSLVLSRPDQALYIPPGIWVELVSQGAAGLLTALASDPYREDDYVRRKDDFDKLRRTDAPVCISLCRGDTIVRPYRPSDAAAFSLSVIDSVATVGRWLSWCRPDYTEQKALDYIRGTLRMSFRSSEFSFGVFTNTGTHVGGVALNRIDWTNRTCNLGYWISRQHTGNGHGKRAARAMVEFAFGTLDLYKVQIQVEVGNDASHHIAESLGAVVEGTLRSQIRRQGYSGDAVLYGIFRMT